MCLLVHVLLYCVGLSLGCLCAYLCNMIVGGGMCHSGGMCIGYVLRLHLKKKKSFLWWFHMYVPYQKSRVCVIYMSVMQGASLNRFDHFMCITMLESHLSI